MKREDYPQVVIAGAARTPVGLKCGTLSGFSAEDLGVQAAEEAIRRSGVARERIDASIGANVYQYTAPGAQDIYFPDSSMSFSFLISRDMVPIVTPMRRM